VTRIVIATHVKTPTKKPALVKKRRPLRDIPFVLTKLSIEYLLKIYYGERSKRVHQVTHDQIENIKNQFANTHVVLLGGLGGFRFGPHWEKAVHKTVGGEVWSLGKGAKDGIQQTKNGVWHCGSGEYRIARWNDEVALVIKRLAAALKASEVLSHSGRAILIGHSSGGLIAYALGHLRFLEPAAFMSRYKSHFPGLSRVKMRDLERVKAFLDRCDLVAVNVPFRGICQRLQAVGIKFIKPAILAALNEAYLNGVMTEWRLKPIDVLTLATHSEMAPKNPHHRRHVISNALGSWLRVISRIQQRGANDGFIPRVSAWLGQEAPHSVRDLDLGYCDHRDVIEHEDIVYQIFKRFPRARRSFRATQARKILAYRAAIRKKKAA